MIIIDVTPGRHKWSHVQMLRKRNERRDLFMKTVTMFEPLCSEIKNRTRFHY